MYLTRITFGSRRAFNLKQEAHSRWTRDRSQVKVIDPVSIRVLGRNLAIRVGQ